MSTKQGHNGPIAVAKLSNDPVEVASRAEGVSDAIDRDKVHFPNGLPIIQKTREDIAQLLAVIKVATSGAIGTATARDSQMKLVKRDVDHLVDEVQRVADTLPVEEAKVFIIQMALFVSEVGHRGPKAEIAVDDGENSGSVVVTAGSLGKYVTYYFEYSLDQATWTRAPDTHHTKIEITGLTPGKLYYFRFRALVGETMRDPSQVVYHMVR